MIRAWSALLGADLGEFSDRRRMVGLNQGFAMQPSKELLSIDDSSAALPNSTTAPTNEKCKVRRKPPRDWLHEREVEAMITAAGRNRHAERDKALILLCSTAMGCGSVNWSRWSGPTSISTPACWWCAAPREASTARSR
jgi:hypothetical protein